MAQFPNLRFEYRCVCVSLQSSLSLSIGVVFLSQLCKLAFCSDPERNWDRSKVKGLVANLFTLCDSANATALEVVAGGRLYNVVVDTEVTSVCLYFNVGCVPNSDFQSRARRNCVSLRIIRVPEHTFFAPSSKYRFSRRVGHFPTRGP